MTASNKGQLTVGVNGVRHELAAGDEAVAAAGRVHAWRNPGEERSLVHVELCPGRSGFEKGLRVAYGFAADGRVLRTGVPRNPLHAALVRPPVLERQTVIPPRATTADVVSPTCG